jgi:hypothetical protein
MSSVRPVDVDAVVAEEITRYLRDSGKDPAAVSDDDRLDGVLGLSSMEVTALLTRISARLDVPGAQQVVLETEIATIGDLRRACHAAIRGTPQAGLDDLAASRQRAAGRRAGRR